MAGGCELGVTGLATMGATLARNAAKVLAGLRARFLDRIRDAVGRARDAWRRVVATAVERGVPTPAFASSLAHYDGCRRERGPANLVQAQREVFGAHTYQRTDRPGVFHTRRSEDGREVEA